MSEIINKIVSNLNEYGIAKCHITDLFDTQYMEYFNNAEKFMYEKMYNTSLIQNYIEAVNNNKPAPKRWYEQSKKYEFPHYACLRRGITFDDGDKERHEQWKKDMDKSTLEFIRKWGQNVNHTPLMKPIVHPVYKKSVIINNTNPELEAILEPWFNGGKDIIVEVDSRMFNQQDWQYIMQLSEIIHDSGEIGTFNLGNLKITINSLNTYEKDLIICKS